MVSRPRLVARLLESPDVPLALVIAPAGFGKTTLLSEWAERDARPFVWVALDDDDNDSACLAASIARALDGIEPIDPTVLVLDDAHVIRSPASLEVISALLDQLPSGSQLALASRTEPALPIGRLRAHRRVLEMRSPDLAMTRSEAAALLGMAGLQLEAGQVDRVLEQTEGWPAGLYLAALALRDQPDVGKALATFDGADRLVADYFRDELLSQAPRAEREFLVRTSVLDSLSGPLCDAVLERTGSARTLAALARSNLLIVPLDRSDERYRYHSLLAGTLRAELRRLEPDREPELNRLASVWYAEHDDPDRAIEHAIAARDPRRAGQLLWQNVARYAPRGRNSTVQRWLCEFTEDEIADVPALALVAATAHLTSGDGNQLRRWTSAAARGLGEAASNDRVSGLEAGLAVMFAGTCDKGLEAMRADAAQAYRLEPQDSPWRSLCCLLEGVARQLIGDDDRARAVLEEGASRGATGAPSVQTLCLAQLALLALDDDDLDYAEAAAGRALEQVERLGIGDYPTEASVFAVSAVVRAARGRVEDAGRDLRRSQQLLVMLTDFVPWYEAEVRVTLARAALKLSDVPTSRALLAEAAPFLRQVPDAAVLHRWVGEARSQADAASAAAVAGGWVLTTAELRVLQFLPSHLSFPEVAERLCVSPNTVKSHARAVYRKLDASSRAEAVVHARNSGLLNGPTAV
ncbi:MAG TPA: LuxR C-terminal-related transcriptional regulator [Thermoleophilaceae bacterium]|nr:LuxR C-terminal-related transcriptional regulator [Thermoleophilaceae bacterium]